MQFGFRCPAGLSITLALFLPGVLIGLCMSAGRETSMGDAVAPASGGLAHDPRARALRGSPSERNLAAKISSQSGLPLLQARERARGFAPSRRPVGPSLSRGEARPRARSHPSLLAQVLAHSSPFHSKRHSNTVYIS